MLNQAQRELTAARSAADSWGFVAVLSTLVLLPANCIINAFDLKAANSIYQLLVREVYSRMAASGTRQGGMTKAVLAALKKAIVEELKRKGLAQYVPGANILVGLAEDSAALVQVVQAVDEGGRDMRALATDIDRKIVAACAELLSLGAERALLIERVQTVGCTA